MKRNKETGEWISSFPPHGQGPFVLTNSDQAIVAVTSSGQSFFGSHAAICAEWREGADVCFQRFELTNPGHVEIPMNPVQRNKKTSLPYNLYYRSWAVDPLTVVLIQEVLFS